MTERRSLVPLCNRSFEAPHSRLILQIARECLVENGLFQISKLKKYAMCRVTQHICGVTRGLIGLSGCRSIGSGTCRLKETLHYDVRHILHALLGKVSSCSAFVTREA